MKIAIIGTGLLGSSFALGLKESDPAHHMIGVDTNTLHANKALQLGIINEIMSFEQAVERADLIVLATPVNIILDQLNPALDIMSKDATLIDFGSTKEIFCKKVAGHPRRSRYVSCHPIAGTENSGPEAAFSSLLRHKQMIICDKEKSDPQALKRVLDLFAVLRCKISYMNAAEHDRHIAWVSHLSHISSFALGLTVLNKEKDEKKIFAMAGSGFSSTVRLAKSNPDMWAPIFSQNMKNISEAVDAYIHELELFKKIINSGDENQSRDLMEKANEIRRVLSGIEKS